MHAPPPPALTHAAGRKSAVTEPLWLRVLLIGAALAVLMVLVVIPVLNVFYRAFGDGWSAYWQNLIGDRNTLHAIGMTLYVAPIAVCLNLLFGLAAAWTVTRFQFPGRTWLNAVIDLPFAISPVVVGLMLMILFGRRGYLYPVLDWLHFKVVFSTPGVILATTIVTMPFIARELIPVMQALGPDEELAAITLGASGWQMFWRVTLPNIKWALLYGVILCNARAMGEYGAVQVVSARVEGVTDTMPLRVEKLYQDPSKLSGSYAVASVLTLLSLVTLGLKTWLEHQTARQIAAAKAEIAADEAAQHGGGGGTS